MNYMTPQEASEKWGVCLRQVQEYCSNNRIAGVKKVNRRWLIPVSAQRPDDGRIHRSQATAVQEPYHFPLFIYSDYYASSRDLNEEEQELLRAQLLMLQCRYSESVSLCNRLANTASLTSVKFGAYLTNSYNYTMLGLYAKLMECVRVMEDICANSATHAADYRFLIAVCKYEYSADPVALQSLDVNTLSPDALIAYECMILQTLVFRYTAETNTSIRIYSAFCKRLENAGILPAALFVHGILALLCERIGDTIGQERHIAETCRIGYKEMFYKTLSQCSALIPDGYHKHLSAYGENFAKRIEKQHLQNLRGWKMIYHTAKGEDLPFDLSVQEYELLLLLYYGMTNKTIAQVKNIPQHEVSTMIKQLCEKCGYQTRAQLIAHAKKLIRSSDEACPLSYNFSQPDESVMLSL